MKMPSDQIERNFTYHPPKPGQIEKYQRIRDEAKRLALLINDECPDCRELSVAIAAVESAVFWANAGIARHDLPDQVQLDNSNVSAVECSLDQSHLSWRLYRSSTIEQAAKRFASDLGLSDCRVYCRLAERFVDKPVVWELQVKTVANQVVSGLRGKDSY